MWNREPAARGGACHRAGIRRKSLKTARATLRRMDDPSALLCRSVDGRSPEIKAVLLTLVDLLTFADKADYHTPARDPLREFDEQLGLGRHRNVRLG